MRRLAKGNERRHLMCFMFKKPPRLPTKAVGGNGHMHVCLDFLRRPPRNRWRGAQPVRCVETNKICAQRRCASASLKCEQICCATWSSPVEPPSFSYSYFFAPACVHDSGRQVARGSTRPSSSDAFRFCFVFTILVQKTHNLMSEPPESLRARWARRRVGTLL